MKLPTLQGIIKRRILVNYRVEPDAIQKILPAAFRPKLHRGQAVAGICLIGLSNIRPKFAPEFIGFDSENAAHRIAVEWDDEKTGQTNEGVYILRRDTSSFLNAAFGGTIFPGEHHRASFTIEMDESKVNVAMRSEDGKVSVEIEGRVARRLPKTSIFASLAEASDFFETGSLGLSVTKDENRLDGIFLRTKQWKLDPLDLSRVHSSFYEDETIFPPDSIAFDHALLMQNVAHEWLAAPDFILSAPQPA
jgi:hypothetical protein